jgi:hypothetical protein
MNTIRIKICITHNAKYKQDFYLLTGSAALRFMVTGASLAARCILILSVNQDA